MTMTDSMTTTPAAGDKATVRFEGQEFQLSKDIAGDDAKLRNALQPVFPEAATAEIHRTTEDGRSVVFLTRKAGTKGARAQDRVLAALAAAPESMNPAIALALELTERERAGELTPRMLLLYGRAIPDATRAGKAEGAAVEAARARLVQARPRASAVVPTGL